MIQSHRYLHSTSLMIINQSSSSATIKAWQTFLNQQGFDVGTADGIWGAHTETGSKEFQSANGLTADGIVGTNTLNAAEAKGFVVPTSSGFNPSGTINTIFDISHFNANPDFVTAKAAGMMAVFHKATQSTTYIDKTYTTRKVAAQSAGLLWGAYHFGASGDGVAQAQFFLNTAKPDGKTMLVLDLERNTTTDNSTMSLLEAKDFINEINTQTGKYPVLYGGSYLKSLVSNIADPVLSKCWLWLAEYSSSVHIPNGWTDYTFWQYTDGVNGPGAVPVEGIGTCDRDLFKGTAAELVAFWTENAS